MIAAATSPGPGSASTEITFSDADFAMIAQRVRADFGLNFPPPKKEMVYLRLIRRLRHLGLQSFADYFRLLDGPDGGAEYQHLHIALTTNVTHFFRENHHFQMLRTSLLPQLIAQARAGARVRLWSAGCSAGQEAYSMAFTVLEACPDADRLDIRILATDVDSAILAKARAGTYPLKELAAIPDTARAWLAQVVASGGTSFAIGEKARKLIQFGELNLMADWPFRGPFDIIFCRNVAIYFDTETQSKLWHRFAGLICQGGHLFIGHSERLSGPAAGAFSLIGTNTYCRLPDQRTAASRIQYEENNK